MVIKKFTAKTEADALAVAKRELGEDVTIIHSRNVKPKGFFSFAKKMQVEITVAKEEDRPVQDPIRSGLNEIDELRKAAERASAAQNAEAAGNAANAGRASSGNASGSAVPTGAGAAKGSDAPQRIDLVAGEGARVTSAVEERLDSIQTLLEQKLNKVSAQRAEAEAAAAEEPDAVQPQAAQEQIDFLKLLYNTMIDNEVGEKYANEMIEEVEKTFKSGGEDERNMEHILSHIYQRIILKFGKSECITPAEHGAKAIFFIGPTGVGKTTTLAKIASRFALIDHKKVVLLTADTYRISATDQLKTYADILGVPFHIIYTTGELKDCFERYKQYDYVLVDTAGHSHRNDQQREDTAAYLHALDDVAQTEKYLVLSATTKYRDLISIADTYREMTAYKLIFTKLDETTTYGNLLNLRLHTMAPMSYVTTGQNVPDDIEEFNAQVTVKKLLMGGDA